jgi:hypothetical protein
MNSLVGFFGKDFLGEISEEELDKSSQLMLFCCIFFYIGLFLTSKLIGLSLGNLGGLSTLDLGVLCFLLFF